MNWRNSPSFSKILTVCGGDCAAELVMYRLDEQQPAAPSLLGSSSNKGHSSVSFLLSQSVQCDCGVSQPSVSVVRVSDHPHSQ